MDEQKKSKLSKRFLKEQNSVWNRYSKWIRMIDWVLLSILIIAIIWAKQTGIYCNYETVCHQACVDYITNNGVRLG